MHIIKRLLSALALLALLTGFVAACGDDDGGGAVASDDDAEEAVDEGAEDEGAEEQAEVDDALAAFCADLNEPDDGSDQPIANIEAKRDLASAAQTAVETPEESDALQLIVDFAQYVIDNDDGDGVITSAEAEAAFPEFPTIEDAFGVLTQTCSGSRSAGGGVG